MQVFLVGSHPSPPQMFNLTIRCFWASLVPIIALQSLTPRRALNPHSRRLQRQSLLPRSSTRHPRASQGLRPSRGWKSVLFLSLSPTTSQPLQLHYESFLPQKEWLIFPISSQICGKLHSISFISK